MLIQDLSWWLVILTVAHVVRIAAGSEEPDSTEATASGGNAVAGKYRAWAGCKPSIARTHLFTSVLHLLWDMFCCHTLQMESCLPQTFPGRTINESTAGSRYFPTPCLKGFGLRQHPEGFVAPGQWHRWQVVLPSRQICSASAVVGAR